jgi:hypothetical protein
MPFWTAVTAKVWRRTWGVTGRLTWARLATLSLAKIQSACDFNRIWHCHSQAKRDSTRT